MNEQDLERVLNDYERAMTALDEERIDDAERIFADMTKRHPDFGPAWLGLASAMIAQERIDDAYHVIGKLEAMHLTDFPTLLSLGGLYYQLEEDDQAAGAYARAEAVVPDSFEMYEALVHGYAELGAIDDALRLARKAQKLAPNSAHAHVLLGRVLTDAGNLEDAVKELERAAKLAPGDQEAHFALGAVYSGQGRFDDAVKALLRAIALNPSFPPAHAVLGAVYAEMGREDDAVRALKQARQLDDEDWQLLNTVARAYVSLNRLEDARATTEHLLALYPDDSEARLMLSSILMNQGKPEEAVAQIAYIRQDDPELLEDLLGDYEDPEFQIVTRGRKPVHPGEPGPAGMIYQLKLTLRNSKPPIWRRVLVPGDFTLAKLHDVIQVAMDWDDSHLHEFIIGGTSYADKRAEIEDAKNETRAKLHKLAGEKGKFVYLYDFGDSWEVEILVEKVVPVEKSQQYPVVIKGKLAAPPDDSGGIWGYYEMLDAREDPDSPDREELAEWLGEDFDPEAFDMAAINARLAQIK